MVCRFMEFCILFVTQETKHGWLMNGGKEFEAKTASRLGSLGWITGLTAVTGGWSADVVTKTDKETLVVQCEDWSGPADLTAIQEVNFARTHHQAYMAIMAFRKGYTRAAREAAKTTDVHLLSFLPVENHRIHAVYRTIESVREAHSNRPTSVGRLNEPTGFSR